MNAMLYCIAVVFCSPVGNNVVLSHEDAKRLSVVYHCVITTFHFWLEEMKNKTPKKTTNFQKIFARSVGENVYLIIRVEKIKLHNNCTKYAGVEKCRDVWCVCVVQCITSTLTRVAEIFPCYNNTGGIRYLILVKISRKTQHKVWIFNLP